MLPRRLTSIGRIRKCLRAFSRPTTCRSRRLRPTLAWSRVRTIRPFAPGFAHCNELFSPGIAGDFTPPPDQFFDTFRRATPGCGRACWAQ